MKFRNQIYDAMKYTLKDWKAIVLLGIILCIASTIEEFKTSDLMLYNSLFIISLIIMVFEEGYRYKIIKNTIEGYNSPPIFGNFNSLLKEGLAEVITLYAYGLFILCINALIDKSPEVIILFLLIITYIAYFLFLGSAINKALHGGKFLSGFNFIEILKLYYKMGLKQSIYLVIVGTISIFLFCSCVFDLSILKTARIIDFLISFFLNPILLLYLTRLMALCGRETIHD